MFDYKFSRFELHKHICKSRHWVNSIFCHLIVSNRHRARLDQQVSFSVLTSVKLATGLGYLNWKALQCQYVTTLYVASLHVHMCDDWRRHHSLSTFCCSTWAVGMQVLDQLVGFFTTEHSQTTFTSWTATLCCFWTLRGSLTVGYLLNQWDYANLDPTEHQKTFKRVLGNGHSLLAVHMLPEVLFSKSWLARSLLRRDWLSSHCRVSHHRGWVFLLPHHRGWVFLLIHSRNSGSWTRGETFCHTSWWYALTQSTSACESACKHKSVMHRPNIETNSLSKWQAPLPSIQTTWQSKRGSLQQETACNTFSGGCC